MFHSSSIWFLSSYSEWYIILFVCKEKQERYRPAEEEQFRVGRTERRVLFKKVTGGKKEEKREIEQSKRQESKRELLKTIVFQTLVK